MTALSRNELKVEEIYLSHFRSRVPNGSTSDNETQLKLRQAIPIATFSVIASELLLTAGDRGGLDLAAIKISAVSQV